MTDTSEWTGSVGTVWAEEWRRTDRSFGALTDRLLDTSDFASALDIGCGAGELVESLARARPTAPVVGVDVSAELIGVARKRCAALANAGLECADAAECGPEGRLPPDLLISRHGVMFFADPVAAFAHLRRHSASTARLRFSCFRAREENGWVAALSSAFPVPVQAPDHSAPGPFAFGNPARVTAILTAAGWEDVQFAPLDYAMIAGEGTEAIDDALDYFQRIGPAARALRELSDADRLAALARLREVLAAHCNGAQVTLPSAAWIVTACAGGGDRL